MSRSTSHIPWDPGPHYRQVWTKRERSLLRRASRTPEDRRNVRLKKIVRKAELEDDGHVRWWREIKQFEEWQRRAYGPLGARIEAADAEWDRTHEIDETTGEWREK